MKNRKSRFWLNIRLKADWAADHIQDHVIHPIWSGTVLISWFQCHCNARSMMRLGTASARSGTLTTKERGFPDLLLAENSISFDNQSWHLSTPIITIKCVSMVTRNQMLTWHALFLFKKCSLLKFTGLRFWLLRISGLSYHNKHKARFANGKYAH